jgi:hypothetical protein
MARAWRIKVGTVKRTGSTPGVEGKHVLFNFKAFVARC